MMYTMLMGGMLGFVSIFLVALGVGKDPLSALGQASMGSFLCGLLFLWVGQIWIKNVRQMLMEKRQAAVAAMAEAEERKKQDAKERGSKPV
ncbi:hypothetical protein [Pelagicoccus sp. SDUM812002]|uniref:hypothetical protein n=1 Tax=Pelagicoccus sp. SDUM812002 TaxID=3041266 RepID=UPI00280EDE4E|nr:hypothetical protein [Pelagicoccus sp. SDUM812002]MDQ8185958.1 hypothetical protein [Pelagicoccus sp. SDUM812002]